MPFIVEFVLNYIHYYLFHLKVSRLLTSCESKSLMSMRNRDNETNITHYYPYFYSRVATLIPLYDIGKLTDKNTKQR